MATIEERTDKAGKTHYRARVRVKGFAPETATFDRKTDAKDWAQQKEADMKAGRHIKTAEGKRHTVSELIDKYIEKIMPRKPKSATQQKGQLEWWRGRIGNVLLSNVTPRLLIEHRDALVKTSASNANRYMAVLSHAFSIAVKEFAWIDDTPFRKIQRLKEPRGIVRFLDDKERAGLLAACKENANPNLYPVVVLAIATGCRKQELLNLRWKDVDFERRLIFILETKNNDRRAVPITGMGYDVLKEHGKIRRIDCDFCFPCIELPKPGDIDRDFARARKKAKIENFRFHDLRHSCASYLAQNGATLAEIAEVLGHKTLSMVKRYAHLTDAHTSKVLERMTSAIFAAPQEKAEEGKATL